MSGGRSKIRYGVPLRIRGRMIIRRALPFLGWAAAVFFLVGLIRSHVAPAQVIGIATESTVPVSSLVPGRLESVTVALHQVVFAGQVVATLDGAAAELEIEAALLDVETLSAELGAARAGLALDSAGRAYDQVALLRRLELDRLDARLGRIAELGRRGQDSADLVGATAELARVETLAGDVIAARRLDEVTATHDALEARVKGRDAVIEAFRVAEDAASSRLSRLPAGAELAVDPFLAPFLAAITAAEKRIDLARYRTKERILRAPVAGQVSMVLQKPGEAVGVDEPIVLITRAKTNEATAWVHEHQLRLVEVGGEVQIRAASRSDVLVVGAIASHGPSVLPVPAHALADPSQEEYGVPVLVRVPEDFQFTPGERVAVRFVRN